MTTASATKTDGEPKRPRKVYRIVSVRFTTEQHEAVAAAAERANEKTATFVRRHALAGANAK